MHLFSMIILSGHISKGTPYEKVIAKLLNTNYENYLDSTNELTEKLRYVSTEVQLSY